MKYAIALAMALPCLLPTAFPAGAAAIEDVVRANCTKAIVSSTDVDRNQIKTFRVNKIGNGYEMIGFDPHHQSVKCTTDDTGRVTWVHVG